MADQDIINLAQEMLDGHNTADYSRFGATLTDDVIYNEFGTQRRSQGRQEVINMWQGWKQVFPDNTGTIQNIFVSGNQALAEVTLEGTFRGDLVTPGGTIPANGRRMEQYPVAFVYIAEGGKFKEVHAYFDLTSLLQQIGATP